MTTLVTIPDTVRHVLHSKAIDETFVIDVLRPASEEALPALILLDGNLLFPLVTAAAQLLWAGEDAAKFMIVGVGYENHDAVLDLRTRDLTPTIDARFLSMLAANGRPLPEPLKPGGADLFHEFLEQSVKPLIAPESNGDYTLAGYSLSGLFALHVLFSNTECYSSYLAASPSIWWDDRQILAVESAHAQANKSLNTRLYTSIGGHEQIGPNAAWSEMVSNWHTFTERLHRRKDDQLDLMTKFFPEETHTSGVASTIAYGLRQLFKPG